MNKQEFLNRYTDTHEELQLSTLIYKGNKGGSLVDNSVSKQEMTNFEEAKGLIEREEAQKRADKLSIMLHDAVDVRASELLDSDKAPITKVIDLAIKSTPKKVDMTIREDVGFLSLYDDIDVSD